MNTQKILSYRTFELIVSMVFWVFTALMGFLALQSCQTRSLRTPTATDIGTVVSISSSDGGSRMRASMLIETTTGYYPVRGQRVFALQEALMLLTIDNGERQVCSVAKNQCMELLMLLE